MPIRVTSQGATLVASALTLAGVIFTGSLTWQRNRQDAKFERERLTSEAVGIGIQETQVAIQETQVAIQQTEVALVRDIPTIRAGVEQLARSAQLIYHLEVTSDPSDRETIQERLIVQNISRPPAANVRVRIELSFDHEIAGEPACEFPYENIRPVVSSDASRLAFSIGTLQGGDEVACTFAVTGVPVPDVEAAKSLVRVQRLLLTCDECLETQRGFESYSGFPAPPACIYVVESGDNPTLIADRFGVSVQALLTANGLDADAIIQPGQELVIPEEGCL